MNTILKCIAIVAVVALSITMAFAEVPQAAPSTSGMTVAELEAKADALVKQKQYLEATTYYKAAIAKDRKNAVLFNKRGIANLQQADYRAAQSDFERAVKLRKNYPEALNNLGVVYYVRKDYGRAVRNYKKALALNEGSASFHSNLGTAWFAQKQLEKAIAEYTRAMELDPDVLMRSLQGGITARVASPADRALYNYIMAKMYAKRGDVDRAVLCLQKAKEEGYDKLDKIYVEDEFASVRGDQRVTQIVPPPVK
jgi:tetratricopeptide (TPR) repeat protein